MSEAMKENLKRVGAGLEYEHQPVSKAWYTAVEDANRAAKEFGLAEDEERATSSYLVKNGFDDVAFAALRPLLAKFRAEARKEEREACAREVEAEAKFRGSDVVAASTIAARIRLRRDDQDSQKSAEAGGTSGGPRRAVDGREGESRAAQAGDSSASQPSAHPSRRASDEAQQRVDDILGRPTATAKRELRGGDAKTSESRVATGSANRDKAGNLRSPSTPGGGSEEPGERATSNPLADRAPASAPARVKYRQCPDCQAYCDCPRIAESLEVVQVSSDGVSCRFNIAFYGPCAQPTDGARFCPAHAKVRCVSCDAPATHECSMARQFVCGYPLCDGCVDDGKGRHVPRTPQARPEVKP